MASFENIVKSVSRRDVFWGYAASTVNVGAGLLLLPVIVRYQSAADVGLWFVFVALASLAQLLDLGFQPTVARNCAYLFAGAEKLTREGLPDAERPIGGVSTESLLQLVDAAKLIYLLISIVAALVLVVGGAIYVDSLLVPTQDRELTLIAWVIFATGYVISLYYGYLNGLLQGRGDVTQANKVVLITRGSFIVLGAATVILGYGLLGLGIASLFSALLGRVAAFLFFRAHATFALSTHPSSPISSRFKLIGLLWGNASKLAIAQVGGFLVLRGSVLLASSMLGLVVAASYSLTVSVLSALSNMSLVLCQTRMPLMSALQVKNDSKTLGLIYGETIVIAGLVYAAGFCVTLAFGNQLFLALGSQTTLIAVWPMVVLGVIYFLEMNHALSALFITTINQVPFVRAALLSGLAFIGLSFVLLEPLGLWGLIVAQGLVQLAYNNWKWPLMASRILKKSIPALYLSGIRSSLKRWG
ncbi:MAG: hypothetical protein FJ184_02120 [Gammaproteobacteria bacterium]|nr:hypothetical protein [Gammaproteobacteria bacterium]